MKENNIYFGFKLIEKKSIEDINSVTYHFVHEQTKAGLLYVENDDENKAFSVSFKTPPSDETGLTHILEHCVLSGSKKYPVKSPFLELRKSSLSTFLNAMTFSDKTMYPVASINDKDFRNLTDTYLDAVFNPLVLEKEEIFLQEGWRYEEDLKDQNIKYNGIVFNEMKGAYSSPDRMLINQIKGALYPDNSYGMDSGGNPEYITSLNYEDFKKYHQEYYHPSNAYFFLYGKLDILDFLNYLNQEYLSNFSFNNGNYEIPLQKNFEEIKNVKGIYGISKEQVEENKTYLSKNFVTGKITDKKEVLSFMVLERVFFDVTGSELKKRLMNAEIAEEIDGFYYTVGQQPFFTFLARNSEEKHFNTFQGIVIEYLEELVNDGIDEELLTGALNTLEFRLRENALSPGKGINYAQSVMNSWLYSDNPVMFLSFSDEIAELREDMKKGWFEKLIRKYFFDNKHAANVILLPSPGLEERKSEIVKEKLEKIKNEFTEEEKTQLKIKNEKLQKYQTEEDTPEKLECIPVIDINDIKKDQEEIPREIIKKEDIEYILHPVFTNKIVYLDIYFKTDRIPEEKIKYIYLLNDIMTSMSTKKYDYQKLSKMINIYTGGIDFSVSCINRYRSRDIFPMMRVSTKTFDDNLQMSLSLIVEIITNTIFKDKKRLKEELIEIRAIKENEFLDDSMGIAQTRLSSYFSESGKYQEEGNIEYYYFLKEILENFDNIYDRLTDNIQEVFDSIFAVNNLVVSITNDKETIEEAINLTYSSLKDLPYTKKPKVKYNFKPENLKEGISIPAGVQYVIKGGSFYKKGFQYNGSMKVAAKILNTDYLWNKLRVTGGAYGGFASVSVLGNIIFSSYRDPNLTETLNVYDESSEFFKNLKLNERELKRYIIGTMGDFDAPVSVSNKGKLSNLYYFQEIEQKDLQKIRSEILATKVADLNNFAKVIEAVVNEDIFCVIGGEDKLESNKEIFKKILKIN